MVCTHWPVNADLSKSTHPTKSFSSPPLVHLASFQVARTTLSDTWWTSESTWMSSILTIKEGKKMQKWNIWLTLLLFIWDAQDIDLINFSIIILLLKRVSEWINDDVCCVQYGLPLQNVFSWCVTSIIRQLLYTILLLIILFPLFFTYL